jgi:hypothetical protein
MPAYNARGGAASWLAEALMRLADRKRERKDRESYLTAQDQRYGAEQARAQQWRTEDVTRADKQYADQAARQTRVDELAAAERQRLIGKEARDEGYVPTGMGPFGVPMLLRDPTKSTAYQDREAALQQGQRYREPRQPVQAWVPTSDGRSFNKLTGDFKSTAPGPGGPGRPGKPLPTPIAQALTNNQMQIRVIDEAIRELEKNPMSTGLRFAGPDWVNQRLDPTGAPARAALSDIGSLQIRDRSGAAVTISEFPRIAPFIPGVKDPNDVALMKLRRLRSGLEEETQAMVVNVGGTVPGAASTSPPPAPVMNARQEITQDQADYLMDVQGMDMKAISERYIVR